MVAATFVPLVVNVLSVPTQLPVFVLLVARTVHPVGVVKVLTPSESTQPTTKELVDRFVPVSPGNTIGFTALLLNVVFVESTGVVVSTPRNTTATVLPRWFTPYQLVAVYVVVTAEASAEVTKW